MAAARGPVAAMPGDRRATRARTSDFSLLGNLTKTKSANAFDMFWPNFRKFEILKKYFHVYMFSCFFRGHAGGWTRHPGADVGFFPIGKIEKNQIR